MKKQTKRKTFELSICALFAALTGILSQLAIPIGPVPINLATFSVFLAGALLGARAGAVSQTVYVLLGIAGVPVFSLFRGGVGVLLGPTGGYIVGYIFAAWLEGLLIERLGNRIYILVSAMLAGCFLYMITGTGWYMFSTKNGLAEALMTCVLPFLPGDALKIVLAAAIAHRLKPVLQRWM